MGITSAQRYNNRMEKIWENARKNGALNEWSCKAERGSNLEFDCTSSRGKGVSLFKDGSVRFTKFEGSEVRVNGKKTKSSGVELT